MKDRLAVCVYKLPRLEMFARQQLQIQAESINFFLSFLQKMMIDEEFHIAYTNQSTILPEFCPPQC